MYRTICTIHRYDMIHMIYTYVSNNSQALTIRLYDTKLFVHNTIRIVRYILYWQDDRKLVARLQSRGGIGRFLFQPSWGFLPSSIRPYRLCKVIHETSHKNLYLILPMKPIQHNLMWLYYYQISLCMPSQQSNSIPMELDKRLLRAQNLPQQGWLIIRTHLKRTLWPSSKARLYDNKGSSNSFSTQFHRTPQTNKQAWFSKS